MKYMTIQVRCDGMPRPKNALETGISEADWNAMSDDERQAKIAEGAWEIIDAWAVAVEETP